MKFFTPVLLSVISCLSLDAVAQPVRSAQKATSAGQRLSAQAYYELSSPGNLSLLDSAHYTYGDTRSSRFDYNNLRYVDLTLLGTGPVTDFLNLPIPTNNIDSSFFPKVDFDSAEILTNIGSTVPAPLHTVETHTFTSANAYDRVTNKVFDNTGTQLYGQRTANVYTSGRLTRVYVSNYNSGVYDTSFIRDLAYDVSGRIVLDSVSTRLSSFTPWSRTIYTYGAGPGFTTATYSFYTSTPPGLAPKGRITNTYYPNALLKSSYFEDYYPSAGAFKPAEADSFGYIAGVLGHTYLRQTILDTAGVRQYMYYTLASRINAAGQKDSVTFLSYQDTVFSGGSATAIAYNTNGDPAVRTDYNLNLNLVPSLYSREYYYYEPIPAAGLAGISPLASEINVYPNPSSGIIHIKIPASYSRSGITVLITDLGGRLVQSESISLPKEDESMTLDERLTPGQYFITIKGNGGRNIYAGSIFRK